MLKRLQCFDKKEEFFFKDPGELEGKPFQIRRCEDCNIYIHDWTNQVTVDLCKKSVIVLGPGKGSTFIRNCEDCQFVVFC